MLPSLTSRVFLPLFSALFLAVLPVRVAPADAPSPSPPPASAAWLDKVTPAAVGAFPPPRSFDASYRLTWADIDAARAEIHCVSDESDTAIRTNVKAASVGAARLLFKLDATSASSADRKTLRPLKLDQTEERSSRKVVSRVVFTPQGATRTVTESGKDVKKPDPGTGGKVVRSRRVDYPGVMDIHSAVLHLRSEDLAAGDERRFIIMSATTPYFATIKVLRRERVKVKAGDYAAIRCSVALQKINKKGELEAYKSLKEATAWISDDADRLLLKVETQIFIGSVNMELEKLTFPGTTATPGR